MSIMATATGYIKWVKENEKFSNGNSNIFFEFEGERENFGKYDIKYATDKGNGNDTILCTASGSKADYILKCYKELKKENYKAKVRVIINGFLEIRVNKKKCSELYFTKPSNDGGEEKVTIKTKAEDETYKETKNIFKVTAVDFIDIEHKIVANNESTEGQYADVVYADVDSEVDDLYSKKVKQQC